MPKVSIVVAVYNVEKYVSKCIESILKQTFTDFELLLVNDVFFLLGIIIFDLFVINKFVAKYDFVFILAC